MSNCIYYVEGECEERFLAAMKLHPARLIPGRVRVFNVVQNLIPKSHLLEIQQGSIITFAFDTDVPNTDCLRKNIERIRKYCSKVRIVYLPQVLDFEDELIRNTDVKEICELTRSTTNKEFKRDFCKLSDRNIRQLLENHRLEMENMWITAAPEPFGFITCNSKMVKI